MTVEGWNEREENGVALEDWKNNSDQKHRPVMDASQEVLVVSDTNRDADQLIVQLQKQSDHIHWAKNDLEAFDFLYGAEGRKTCLVVIDLQLPNPTGLRLLSEIRLRRTTRNLPVILLAPFQVGSSLASADRGPKLLPKPVLLDDFRKIIGQLGLSMILA